MIRYWYKLLEINDHALQKIVYFMLRDDVQNGINYVGANRAFQMKSILESHGLGYEWRSQHLETVPFVLLNNGQSIIIIKDGTLKLTIHLNYLPIVVLNIILIKNNIWMYYMKRNIELHYVNLEYWLIILQSSEAAIRIFLDPKGNAKYALWTPHKTIIIFYSCVLHIKISDASIFHVTLITDQPLQNLITWCPLEDYVQTGEIFIWCRTI